MKLYIISTRFGGEVLTQYDGFDQETVETLMLEMGHEEINFVDEATYNAALEAAIGG